MDSIAAIRDAALYRLGAREHSRWELQHKLALKLRRSGGDAGLQAAIVGVLDSLEADGYLSDRRFAESFVRSRHERGQGMLRIRQELRQRGVNRDLAEETLARLDYDWFALARTVRERRFGLHVPADRKGYAQQVRFLQYRGFDPDQVRYALDSEENE